MAHLARIAGLAIAFCVCVGGSRTGDAATFAAPASAMCIPASQCCKICEKGYACGNSCISRSKKCHKGRGCACNSDEVCGTRLDEPARGEARFAPLDRIVDR